MELVEALVRAGHRRLRPVLMTSLAAALGMLPLAYGIGAGADMLRPLAIAVIGALCISVLLSLIATPVAYYLLLQFTAANGSNDKPEKRRKNGFRFESSAVWEFRWSERLSRRLRLISPRASF